MRYNSRSRTCLKNKYFINLIIPYIAISPPPFSFALPPPPFLSLSSSLVSKLLENGPIECAVWWTRVGGGGGGVWALEAVIKIPAWVLANAVLFGQIT